MAENGTTGSIDGLIISLLKTNGCKPINREFFPHDTDWDDFLAGLIEHNLGPIAYKKLARPSSNVDIPEPVLTDLETSFYESLANNLLYQSELENILNLLNKSATSVIVLKGMALANTVYSNPALRPFCDIDILIKEKDWQIVRAAFLKLGYANKKKDFDRLPIRLTHSDMMDHCLAFSKNNLSFDIKLDLLELGVGMRESRQLWETAEPFNIGGSTALSLSLEYQLIHLCVHLNRHGFTRLIWFNDIVLLLQSKTIDWELVGSIAKRENIQPVIYYVLSYVNEIFGDLAPKDGLAALKPSFIKTKIWNSLWPKDDVLGFCGRHELALVFRKRFRPAELIANMLLMGRPIDKIDYFARKLLPSEDFLSEKSSSKGTRKSYLRNLTMRYLSMARKPSKKIFSRDTKGNNLR